VRAYRVAYDGRQYNGFQRQPDVPTVEGSLLAALDRLGVHDRDSGPPEGYAAAGRTDAGVSAVAQTIAFAAPDWLLPVALNSELPDDIRVWATESVSAEFHATHDPVNREYTYYLYAPDGSAGLADDALAELTGNHDFHNLTPDTDGTVRTLSGSIRRDGDFLVMTLSAGGFARQLVRRIVGLVAEIVDGGAPLSKIDRVFSLEPLPGPEGIAPAPAYPLVLTDVTYPDISFTPDSECIDAVRSLFEDYRAEHRTRARVAGCVLDGLGEEYSC
jgi:tRNA pseudouridine38-40 synthase